MKVLGSNVLIKVDKVEKSIIITEESHEVSNKATIIAFGPDVPFDLEKGSRVLWNNKQGKRVV